MNKAIFSLIVWSLALALTLPVAFGSSSSGGASLFAWLWLLAPFAIYYFLSKKMVSDWINLSTRRKVGLILFSITAVGIPVFYYVRWIFSIGSPTGTIISTFEAPLFAFVLSFIPILLMSEKKNKN